VAVVVPVAIDGGVATPLSPRRNRQAPDLCFAAVLGKRSPVEPVAGNAFAGVCPTFNAIVANVAAAVADSTRFAGRLDGPASGTCGRKG